MRTLKHRRGIARQVLHAVQRYFTSRVRSRVGHIWAVYLEVAFGGARQDRVISVNSSHVLCVIFYLGLQTYIVEVRRRVG